MIKRLVRHGNSRALVIDRAILELLKIDEETPLSISTDGRCLVIEVAGDDARRAEFEKAMRKIHKRHARAFRRLAE